MPARGRLRHDAWLRVQPSTSSTACASDWPGRTPVVISELMAPLAASNDTTILRAASPGARNSAHTAGDVHISTLINPPAGGDCAAPMWAFHAVTSLTQADDTVPRAAHGLRLGACRVRIRLAISPPSSPRSRVTAVLLPRGDTTGRQAAAPHHRHAGHPPLHLSLSRGAPSRLARIFRIFGRGRRAAPQERSPWSENLPLLSTSCTRG